MDFPFYLWACDSIGLHFMVSKTTEAQSLKILDVMLIQVFSAPTFPALSTIQIILNSSKTQQNSNCFFIVQIFQREKKKARSCYITYEKERTKNRPLSCWTSTQQRQEARAVGKKKTGLYTERARFKLDSRTPWNSRSN